MSRWVEEFNSHAFQSTWSNLKDILKSCTTKGTQDDNAVKELARLKKVTSYLDSVLKGIDPELAPLSILSNANQHATNCKTELTSFIGNKNYAHLQNANGHIDNLITNFSQVTSIPSAKIKTSLLSAATEYNKVLDDHLSVIQTGFHDTIQSYSSQLEELQSNIETQSNQVTTTNSELSATQQTINSLTGELQTQFQAAQTERQSRFDAVVADHRSKFDTIMDVNQADIKDEFKDLATKSAATMGVLSQYQSDAEKILGVVVNTAQAGAYKSYANEEKRTANTFRFIAISLMFVAAAILVVPEISKLISIIPYSVDWKKILIRLPISMVLFAPAIYMAKESNKHRENEFRNKRRELILTTIDPFLALLDDEKDRDEIKKEVAKTIFSDVSSVPGKSDTGDMLAQLSNLVKQITKLPNNG